MIWLLLPAAWSATLTTCGDTLTSDCEPSIADAVANAADGDTILLAPGVYAEAISLEGRELTIASLDELDRALLIGAGGASSGPVFTVRGGSLSLGTVELAPTYDRALLVEDASVKLDDVWVRATVVQTRGGAIYASDATLELIDSRIEGGVATVAGGHVYAVDSDVLVDGGQFTTGRVASGEGGSFAIEGLARRSTLTITGGATWKGNEANRRGGAIAVSATDLDLREPVFRSNVAQTGAGLAALDARGEIRSARFELGEASIEGGGAAVGGEVALIGGVFCENRAEAGGALSLLDGHSTVANVRFVGNVASTGGAVQVTSTATIAHAGFYDNRATGGGAAVEALDRVAFVDNLVYGNTSESGGDVLTGTLDVGVNLFYGNTAIPAALEGQVHDDPRLLDLPDGCDGGAGYPSWSGAARDAGAEGLDPDGSPPDIGPYGGPNVSADALLDGDGDRWEARYDCRDYDADVRPGALEVYYDGDDANCDARSDYDADEDGFDAELHGGADCDDTEPTVSPVGVEVPKDGVDQDCVDGDLTDIDGDGWDEPADCGPQDPTVYPGAVDDDPTKDADCDGYADFQKPLVPRPCGTGSSSGAWLLALLLLRLRKARR